MYFLYALEMCASMKKISRKLAILCHRVPKTFQIQSKKAAETFSHAYEQIKHLQFDQIRYTLVAHVYTALYVLHGLVDNLPCLV